MAPKPLPYKPDSLKGISEKTMMIHHDKLYAGYVAKKDDIGGKLKELREKIVSGESSGSNPTYSDLRSLKRGEIFAVNAVNLHEWYFDILGPSNSSKQAAINLAPELSQAISNKWGSVENFIKYFSECGMAARGWCILAWDSKDGELKQYNTDVHHEGIWGAFPIITLDVYEHAYFIDYGSDRKKYIEDYWANLNWHAAEQTYLKVRGVKL